MTHTSSRQRYLKYGRFARRQTPGATSEARSRRGAKWTGYRPLVQAVAEARLTALEENSGSHPEERR
jgi:hypothetical protein